MRKSQWMWILFGGMIAGQNSVCSAQTDTPKSGTATVRRLPNNPIITPQSDPSIGTNINGASLIRVPKWIKNPLGVYYLYFADHKGKFIRLAYADKLDGQWKIYVPGTLPLAESHFTDHLASPDAVVDDKTHQIRLYYHGLTLEEKTQHTRVALSSDGIHFVAREKPVGIGSAYWRLFHQGEWWYALAMPGKLWRSKDGLSDWETGQTLFAGNPIQVHNAVLVRGDTLHVWYTRAGDKPERIVYASVNMAGEWKEWKPSAAQEFLKPERDWEGASLPLEAGIIGGLDKPVHALRDPAIFEDKGKLYLLYAIAGESGIAIAEIELPK